MPDPAQRFLDSSNAARKRRRMRLCMRKQEQHREDEQTSRRTNQLPCCGRERRYCKCAREVEYMINGMALDKLADQACHRNKLTKMDPQDMNFILRALHQSKLSIHGFLFHSVLFRMYSRESTYRALGEYAGAAQPGKNEPDWLGMEAALAKLYAESDPVWGGMFYPATLRAAKDKTGRWRKLQAATPKQQAKRDMHVHSRLGSALQR